MRPLFAAMFGVIILVLLSSGGYFWFSQMNGPLNEIQQPPQPPTDSTSAFIEQQIQSLVPGQVVFNPPKQMRVGRSEYVTVRITRGSLENSVKEGLLGRGIPQIEEIKVGHFMAVKLFGRGFEIVSKSKEDQTVPDHGLAEWVFDVLPVASGEQTLVLQVFVRFKTASVEEATELPVFSRDIVVDVDYWWDISHFVTKDDNWKWFLGGIGTVIVSVGGYFGKRWLERRNKHRGPSNKSH